MNIGASSTACCERLLDRAAADVARDLVEREAVVRTERQHDRVVARRGLQLEVEGAAELLAQRETERAVDPAAVRRVDDELHPAGVVEEAFEHERVEGRDRAEHGTAARDVVDDHRGRVDRDAGGLHQPRARAVGIAELEELADPLAQCRHLGRELGRARGCLAAPERHGRRRIARVGDAHDAGFDAADLPRVRAEQEDVARHRLDRPVLVDRADEQVVGIGEHAVVADLGDRATRRDRREARALAAAHLAVDRVVVHVSTARSAAGLDAVRRELEHLVELRARQLGVRHGASATSRRARRCPTPARRPRRRSAERGCRAGAGAGGSRRGARRAPRRASAAHSTSSSRVDGIEATLRHTGTRVVRSADALQERRDAAGRADLAHELDRADVDAELERGRCHQRPQLAGAQARSRRGTAGPWRGCRGARRRRRRRAARRAGARAVRRGCGCSRTRASCGAPARARRSGRARRPSAPRSRPPRARPPGSSIARSSAR